MGRLTLNVLLSFAQFEREVTGERIRDKIAASKKKGMWMGGKIPLGYEVKDRKLMVNANEANTIKYTFNQYIQLKSVRKLKQHLDQTKYKTKQNKQFSRGALYKILANPLYIGKVRHKHQVFNGEHKAILNLDVWKQTQSILRFNNHENIHRSNVKERSLLTGLLFDDRGHRMSPSHTNKGDKRYRYYVSQALIQHQDSIAGSIARVTADEIESAVFKTLSQVYSDASNILKIIGYVNPELSLIKIITKQTRSLIPKTFTNEALVKLLPTIQKIIINKNNLVLHITRDKFAEVFGLDPIKRDHYIHNQTIHWQQNCKGQTLMLPGENNMIKSENSAQSLRNATAKALEWNQGLLKGSFTSLREIAQKENVRVWYIRRILRLAYLSPDTLVSIHSKSSDFNLERTKIHTLLDWQM